MTDLRPNSMSGAELAVLTARFEGVARKMANTLHRTGRSGIFYDRPRLFLHHSDRAPRVADGGGQSAYPCAART